jgi:anti-sigma factor RsiW
MSDVTCAAGVERLMDYLEDVLPTDVRAALEAHVARCPRCTAFIASYVETPRILRQATAVALPAEQQQALRDFLRAYRHGAGTDI